MFESQTEIKRKRARAREILQEILNPNYSIKRLTFEINQKLREAKMRGVSTSLVATILREMRTEGNERAIYWMKNEPVRKKLRSWRENIPPPIIESPKSLDPVKRKRKLMKLNEMYYLVDESKTAYRDREHRKQRILNDIYWMDGKLLPKKEVKGKIFKFNSNIIKASQSKMPFNMKTGFMEHWKKRIESKKKKWGVS